MLNTVNQTKQKLLTIKEVAEILGLDYFHARKLLLEDKTIGVYTYGTKRLWDYTEIMNFKNKHYTAPVITEA